MQLAASHLSSAGRAERAVLLAGVSAAAGGPLQMLVLPSDVPLKPSSDRPSPSPDVLLCSASPASIRIGRRLSCGKDGCRSKSCALLCDAIAEALPLTLKRCEQCKKAHCPGACCMLKNAAITAWNLR